MNLPVAKFEQERSNSFDPRFIPGCTLWLDATDNATLSIGGFSSVTNWRDKASNVNFVTQGNSSFATIGNTINNRQAIHFDNTSNNVYSQATFASPIIGSFFFVVKARSTGGFRPYITWFNGGGRFPAFGNRNNTDTVGAYTTFGGAGSVGIPITNNTNYIFFYGFNNGTTSISSNAALTPTAGTQASFSAAGTTTNCWLCADGSGASSRTPVHIGEIILYNSVLSTTYRQQVEGYLTWKWGFTASVPAGLPFRLYPPIVRNFSPLDIISGVTTTGLQLWLDAYDANTVTLDGSGNVTSWIDKSGFGRNLANSGTVTYTANSIYCFNSYMFINNAVDLTNVTCFFVGNFNSVGSQTVFIGRPNTSASNSSTDGFELMQNFVLSPAARSLTMFGNATTNMANNYSTTNYIATYVLPSSGTALSYINGTAGTTFTGITRTSTAQGFAVGARWSGSAYTNATGQVIINEILVYNFQLSLQQIQQVESYLADKWALRPNLPAAYPLRNLITMFPVFTPIQLLNCDLWLDAADLSTLTFSGANITQWRDKSANGRTFTNAGTVTTTSQNGLNVLSMAGGQRMTTSSFTWSTFFTQIFVVSGSTGFLNCTWDVARNFYRFINASLNTPLILISNSGDSYFRDTTAPPYTATGYYILVTGYNSGSAVTPFTLNGSPRTGALYSGSGSGSASFTDPFYINGNNTSTNLGANNVAEIIHYNRNLTLSEYKQIEGYLANKWGINTVLPAAHPYKRFRN